MTSACLSKTETNGYIMKKAFLSATADQKCVAIRITQTEEFFPLAIR